MTQTLCVACVCLITEQDRDTELWHTFSTSVTMAPLSDPAYCGHHHAFVVADSEHDIEEANERDNVWHGQVYVRCQAGKVIY